MKPEFKLVTILLGILVILDAAAVPFMIAANHHTHGTPPGPAIVLAGVIAVATLISALGVARGLRWAFWVAMTCRIIDAAQNFLGLTNHPTPVTTVGGGIGLVLSLAAIAALVRGEPPPKGADGPPRGRRVHHRQPTGTVKHVDAVTATPPISGQPPGMLRGARQRLDGKPGGIPRPQRPGPTQRPAVNRAPKCSTRAVTYARFAGLGLLARAAIKPTRRAHSYWRVMAARRRSCGVVR